ncbi:hypothetical protein A7P53_06425 [Acinetobacter defluvii]|uniref:hypothetical protein n=1 Tax=Acinetobacter defluvii TaxID=1871111 RepID=UPI00148F6821|nr:hypothetical protein [Acinetobacter defluvii]NNP72099.1 hypothetical protein [Acinetobacter defluvii]
MDILNAKQAFEAMSSGQAVLCRAVGQPLDFGELSQFPATVFFGSEYEFCLAPRFMTIGQLDLEVPECLQGFDDLIDAAMYYAPNLLNVDRPIEILSTADNATYLKRLITSKLLHKTADDAIAHARAFITLNGGSLDPVEIESPVIIEAPSKEVTESSAVETIQEKPIKKRTRKAKQPAITDAVEAPIKAEPTPKSHPAFTVDDVAEIETDPTAIIEKFTAQIANCTTTDAVLSLRPIFFANGHLECEQQQYLCKLTEDKLLELDPEQYAPKADVETVAQEEVTVSKDTPADDYFLIKGDVEKSRISSEIKQELTYKIVQMSADELDAIAVEIYNNPKLVSTHKGHLDGHIELRRKALAKEADAKYQELLNNLLDRAANAQTPAEATALTGYTKSWTEEQRKPLLDAIHNRLNTLSADAQPIEQPPSLMVQIQNAPDLTALDALEIDVHGRHPDIQPKLMGYIRARRFELENGAAQ